MHQPYPSTEVGVHCLGEMFVIAKAGAFVSKRAEFFQHEWHAQGVLHKYVFGEPTQQGFGAVDEAPPRELVLAAKNLHDEIDDEGFAAADVQAIPPWVIVGLKELLKLFLAKWLTT